MRISDLEKALKRGIMMNPGQPALAHLSAGSGAIPAEFADSARSIMGRDSQHVPGNSIL